MTITLHWWLIPAAIASIAVFIGTRPVRDWGDLMNPIVCAGLLAIAAAFCVGHWLA
jgi:hypothetical protein